MKRHDVPKVAWLLGAGGAAEQAATLRPGPAAQGLNLAE